MHGEEGGNNHLHGVSQEVNLDKVVLNLGIQRK